MVALQGIMQAIDKVLQDEGQLTKDLAQLDKLLGEAGGAGKGTGGSGGCGGAGGAGGSSNNQGVSGTGTIWGDPHFTDSNGNQNYSIQGQTGGTYNLLSDTGIEVNGKFQAYGTGGAETVGEMGINLNGDQIDIKPAQSGNGEQLTINGQQIDTSKPGSYLNGAVTVNKDGSVTVKNDHYTLNITNGGGYLNTSITATNAGRLQQVGGMWGQSLETTKPDTNPADFQVGSLFSRQGENGGNGGGNGGTTGTGNGWSNIPTNFTPPTLPSNPTTQQTLQFEEQMFTYASEVSASTTAINSEGNALKDASSKVAQ